MPLRSSLFMSRANAVDPVISKSPRQMAKTQNFFCNIMVSSQSDCEVFGFAQLDGSCESWRCSTPAAARDICGGARKTINRSVESHNQTFYRRGRKGRKGNKSS